MNASTLATVTPHPSAQPLSLSCADTAKIMRQSLKAAFPDTKFSVRSSLYSMGSSIHVSWIDGPTVKAVDAIVDSFAACWFDGMDDSTHYNPAMVIDGRRMDSGANYVSTSRRFSPAFLLAVAEHVAVTVGCAIPEIRLNSDGSAYIDPANRIGWDDGTSIADRIHQALQTASKAVQS
jgi:hypothetical protein